MLVSLALAPVIALLVAPPAHAGTLDDPDPLGHVTLVVSSAPGGFDVCWDGSVTAAMRVAGVWTVLIGGTTTTPPTATTSTGATVSGCRFVSSAILPGGQIAATVSYVAVGTSVTTSVLALSVGGGTWAPLIGGEGYAVDLNQ
jgi:hypothetical protein